MTGCKQNLTVEEVASSFFYNYHFIVNERHIRLDGSEYKKAKNDSKTWLVFQKITKFLIDNDINHTDYIQYTFNHYKKYIHPKTLLNLGNIQRYNKIKEEQYLNRKYDKIYNLIMKSIKNVVLICKTNELENINDFFKFCIEYDTLALYIVTGKISKYFLAMFNNIEQIAKLFPSDSYFELNEHIIKHREQINQESRMAIFKMTGKKSISIVSIVNHNIKKQLGTSSEKRD
jgi:hypothetical protein